MITQPSHGTLSGAAPNLTYTPAANYAGADQFTFETRDGTLTSSAATVSITVTALNDAPVITSGPTASPNSVLTNQSVNFLVQAQDVEGSPLTCSWNFGDGMMAVGETAAHAYATAGSYIASVKVVDNQNGSVTGNVTLTVTAPINHAPSANSQSVSVIEDTAKGITLTGSDADGNSLSYSVVSQPVNGTLSGVAPNLTYTPKANFNGSDSFTFKVNDGSVDSSTAAVSITVSAVNDTPTISNITDQTTAMNTVTAPIAFTVGDVETAASSLTVSGVSGNTTLVPAGNIVLGGSGANRTVTIIPANTQSGTAKITVTVSDGALTASTAFILTVSPSTDSTKPVVSISSPLDGARVPRGKTITITTQASDNVGVTQVEFYINGVFYSRDSSSPYAYAWKVPPTRYRTYQLQVKAYDAKGNVGVSSIVKVTAR